MVALALLCVLASPVLPDAMDTTPSGEPLTPSHHSKLERGKILSTLLGERGTSKTVVALAVVQCTPSSVFAGLVDYDNNGDDMPYVSSLTVEKNDDGTVDLSYQLDLPWPLTDRHYTVHILDEPSALGGIYRSSWIYVPGSGNIRDTSGSFEIVAYGPTRSLVRYTAHADPGGKIPKWALNLAARSSVPDVLRTLRNRCATQRAAAKSPS